MTGNWFCVPNGCARVNYREYSKSPRILYRYSNEDWVSVDGDDYSLKQTYDLNDFSGYIYADATVQVESPNPDYKFNGYGCGDTITIRSRKRWSGVGVIDYELNNFEERKTVELKLIKNESIDTVDFRYPGYGGDFPNYLNHISVPYIGSCSSNLEPGVPTRIGVKSVRNIRFEGIPEEQLEIKSCTLTITKDGQVVYQETRDICPEVELETECKLSETWQEIKVDKIPFATRLEVVPYGYGLQKGVGLPIPIPEQQKIPSECLEIYVNEVYLPIPPDFPQGEDQSRFGFGFEQQICSAPGCPPPEYMVTCDCDCQSCPDGTCAVFCADHVCCADKTTGKIVIEIPLEEYCVEGF